MIADDRTTDPDATARPRWPASRRRGSATGVLERAAWLARETDRPLRDIAAECGFRGYDVFVRAFRRELGASPSEWRAHPTTWEIDAPGEVHFHPPDGIRPPARASHDETTSVTEAYLGAFAPGATIADVDHA